MKRILLAFRPLAIIVVVIVGVWTLLSHINASRQEYLAFSQKRDLWLARCEVYKDTPLRDSPAAQLCNKELQELTAYAKAKGWTK